MEVAAVAKSFDLSVHTTALSLLFSPPFASFSFTPVALSVAAVQMSDAREGREHKRDEKCVVEAESTLRSGVAVVRQNSRTVMKLFLSFLKSQILLVKS